MNSYECVIPWGAFVRKRIWYAAVAVVVVGGPALAEDPYIEGNGTQFFTVPYYTTPKSKVVVDFKMPTDKSKTVLGTSNTLASVANVYFWSNGYGNLEGHGAGKWSHSLCALPSHETAHLSRNG